MQPSQQTNQPVQPPQYPPTAQPAGSPAAPPASPVGAPYGQAGPVTAGGGAAPLPQPAEPTIKNPNSTQNSLLITEIRDGLVVLGDGSFRAVVACRSINFDLMSEREREGIEFSYQNFLNSLYFDVQILVRSQRVDIAPYLEKLSNLRRSQENMLLGILMEDYIGFIAALAQETNIMEKSFYVVVPYFSAGNLNSTVNSSKNLLTNLFSPQKQLHVKIDEATYNKARDELANRVNAVISGLFQAGVSAKQLGTKELGELYYNCYNPDTAVREPLVDFDNHTSIMVQKGDGQAPRPSVAGGEVFK